MSKIALKCQQLKNNTYSKMSTACQQHNGAICDIEGIRKELTAIGCGGGVNGGGGAFSNASN